MNNYKILIVEDDPFIATLLRQLLVRIGHDVLPVLSNGEDVIDYFDTYAGIPDLVFMDINLSGKLDGIETVIELSNIGIELPLIYLTANAYEENIDKLKRTKPLALLKKPFDEEQLRATLEVSIYTSRKRAKEMDSLKQIHQESQIQINELIESQKRLVEAAHKERRLKEELEESHEIIEKQTKKILDSINYALRIQEAILPKDEEIKSALGEYFMFYKPKDIISGDFPWLYQNDDFIYVAAVDCTGHGVPGAMMSLIGFFLLSKVSDTSNPPTPAAILNELHHEIVKTLRQDDPLNKAADGMDMALCRLDKHTGEIVYSGAHRPLYHYSKGEVLQYKGDKFPIGGMQYKGANHFNDARVEASKGDAIYLFSDGYPDQFGGPRELKFGPRRIRELIALHGDKPMSTQKQIFETTFFDWKGNERQMDDILFIGVRI